MTSTPTHTPEATYWVSIGRNVGPNPLPAYDWATFQGRIRTTVNAGWVNGSIVTEVHGSSTWGGIAEDTYLVLVTLPTSNVEAFRAHLATIATYYRQDGIGFVGGPGTDTYVTPEGN